MNGLPRDRSEVDAAMAESLAVAIVLTIGFRVVPEEWQKLEEQKKPSKAVVYWSSREVLMGI
jgi:hypothetical protein